MKKRLILSGVIMFLIAMFTPVGLMAQSQSDVAGEPDSSVVGIQIDATNNSVDVSPELEKQYQDIVDFANWLKKRKWEIGDIKSGSKKKNELLEYIFTTYKDGYDKSVIIYERESSKIVDKALFEKWAGVHLPKFERFKLNENSGTE